MSDTPRTDRRIITQQPKMCGCSYSCEIINADFARRLERELNAAKSVIESLEDALIDISEYWDLDERETSMSDACWHAVGTAKKALDKIKQHNK